MLFRYLVGIPGLRRAAEQRAREPLSTTPSGSPDLTTTRLADLRGRPLAGFTEMVGADDSEISLGLIRC